ncbi:MAG: tandem-95 repeat protein, partial [Chloroflexi bacterium]|nr:tandem-95 repeat protein [Chloroflexota bacterium]
TLNYERYTFDFDGPAFATFVRDQMEATLHEQGELPAGMSLDASQTYRQTTGSGEIWLNEAGLPVRLTVDLDLGLQKNGERVAATVTTDYSEFDLTQIEVAATSLWQEPTSWLSIQGAKLTNTINWQQISSNVSLFLMGIILVLFIIRYRRTRWFYGSVIAFMILAMLVGPLLQAEQTHAFYESQYERQLQQLEQQKEADVRAEAQAALRNNDWHPNQDPLASAANKQLTINSSQFTNEQLLTTDYKTLIANASNSVDTDGDGLNDDDEAFWLTDPTLADTDGDGLSDGIEVNGLGTLPTYADTDNDGISDLLEVTGFTLNGTNWYMDPNEPDTNQDGLPDSIECETWVDATNPTTICPDTDNDNIPDIFDHDNDNDGVEDSVDSSPFSGSNQSFDGDNPFELVMNGLEVDKPVLVDMQFRPTNPDNMTLNGHILDWPSGDTEGQITRRWDTTFLGHDNPDIASSDDNAGNGDVRLIPMLEVTMPYEAGHYANLPITDTIDVDATPRDTTMAVADWLDSSELNLYAINVDDEDDEDLGKLVAYLPLNTVTSSTGDGIQAFAATMYYQPEQEKAGTNGLLADWGPAHEYRVLWLVQMITEECVESDDEETCTEWQETLEVIHVYYDEWEMTSLAANEQHGLETAVLYEDPVVDEQSGGLTIDDQLVQAGWSMSNTWLDGRDCGDTAADPHCDNPNGERDVTLSNLQSTIDDNWSGEATANVVVQLASSYPHEDYAVIAASETADDILTTQFQDYTDLTNPTLLYATENTIRSANQDSAAATYADNRLTLNFAHNHIEKLLFTSMNWVPYTYADDAWQVYTPEAYLVWLEEQVQAIDPYFTAEIPGDTTSEAEAEGKRIWVQLNYVTFYNGLTSVAEIDSIPVLSYNYEIDEAEWSDGLAGWGVIADNFLASVFSYSTTTHAFSFEQMSDWYGNAHEMFTVTSADTGTLAVAINFVGKWAARFSFALLIVGATLTIIGAYLGSDILVTVGTTMLAIGALAINALKLATIINKVWRSLESVSQMMTGYAGGGIISLGVGLVVTWGIFFATILSEDLSTLELSSLIAGTIASTIILILVFILTIVSIVGVIIGLIVGIIDLILFLVGTSGITEIITERIANMIYAVDEYVTNLSDPDRLGIDFSDVSILDAKAGIVEGNSFLYTIQVTSTLESEDVRTKDLREATFVYAMQTDDTTPEDVAPGEMYDDWQFVAERDQYCDEYSCYSPDPAIIQHIETFQQTILLIGGNGSGINKILPLYLIESYAAPFEGCWVSSVGCTFDYTAGHNPIDLGESLVYDILPDTIGEFASLSWNGSGNVPFPEQIDLDGDGMTSSDGDPDDTNWDTDGDLLSDPFELNKGWDPEEADGDGDGLTDKQELLYNTNPYTADTDGDGLNDYIETVQGWLVNYGPNITDITRVWSDPNVVDADADNLTDLEEFVFGFHPQVATDPSIIENIVQIDDIRVDEAGAPLVWYKFEELNSEAFSDSSGAGNTAVCDNSEDACPTTGEVGRYGYALRFDGDDDNFSTSEEIGLESFTVAAWVNPYNDSNLRPFVSHEAFDLGYNYTGDLFSCLSHDDFVSTGPAPLYNFEWYHVACTYDATTNRLKLYIDGESAASKTISSSAYSSSPLDFGNQFNSFAGLLDDVVVMDEALSATEIEDVMNGRFNLNDQLVRPGQDLTYLATISNTHASQSIDGFMTAASSFSDPELPLPYAVFHFNAEDMETTLINSDTQEGNDVATCALALGTCPYFQADGQFGSAAQFDGVDDVIELRPLIIEQDYPDEYNTSYFDDQLLAMWLKVDSLPTGNNKMFILDTDNDAEGALDLYINSAGNLVLDVVGASDVGVTEFSFADYLGEWKHITLFDDSFLIDGESDRLKDDTNQDITIPDLIIGPGTLGNSITSNDPFAGRMDEFLLYTAGSLGLFDGDDIRNGIYNVNSDDDEPYLLFTFDEIEAYDGTYFIDNNSNPDTATCDAADSCPVLTGTDGGQDGTGRAIHFDGTDDRINLNYTTVMTDGVITMWLKVDALPTGSDKMMLLDTESGEFPLDIWLDAAGQIVVDTQISDPLTSDFAFTAPSGWTKVAIEFDRYYESETTSWKYGSTININDVYDSDKTWDQKTDGSVLDDTVQLGAGYIGGSATGDSYFAGDLDDFSTPDYSIDFNLEDSSADVTLVNHMNEARAARCVDVLTCPAIGSGKFGDGLAVDGQDDYLAIPDDEDINLGIHPETTVSVWFQVVDASLTEKQVIYEQGGYTRGLNLYVYNGQLYGGGWNNDSSQSNWSGSFIVTDTIQSGQWHHAALVLAGGESVTADALRLYLDGILVGTADGSQLWSHINDTGLGAVNDQTKFHDGDVSGGGYAFNGLIDELVLIPAAVEADAIVALASGVYPAINIDEPVQTMSAPANTTLTAVGDAQIDENAGDGVHRFDQEVEVALQNQSLNIPVVDDNAGNLVAYLPFEEVPGATSFNNLVQAELVTCTNGTCPTSGLRGIVDRAVFFDGIADMLTIPEYQTNSYKTNTVSVWVNGNRGTILDTRYPINREDHLRIHMDSVQIGGELLTYDIPDNEWTHLAVTTDESSNTVKVYINGALEGTLSPSTLPIFQIPPSVGADRDATDFYHGFIDDLRIYDVDLAQSDIQDLYNNSAPILRYEFDEESDDTVYLDASPNNYTGVPTNETCTELTLDMAVLNNTATDTTDLVTTIDGEWIFNDTVSNITANSDLAAATILCEQATLELLAVKDDGSTTSLGTQTVDVTNAGATTTQTFVNGDDSVTLTWTTAVETFNLVNPLPGTEGKIGNTALFDGEGFITVAEATTIDDLTNEFTIMGWIKPDELVGLQRIFSSGQAGVQGISFGFNDDRLLFSAFGVQDYDSNSSAPLVAEQWQHVAVVFDANNDATFYIDGVSIDADDEALSDTITGSNPALANSPDRDPIYVGAVTQADATTDEFFKGEIDELSVYGRALLDTEIDSIHQRELQWYRDSNRTYLKIDNDAPTITLLSTDAFRSHGLNLLGVSVTDLTSNISLVDFGLKIPDATEFVWTGAPLCKEATSAWCPSFDTEEITNYEGAYEVQFRAVDAVGHETLSDIYTYYVDGTEPDADSSYNDSWVTATALDSSLNWTVSLTGSLDDPLLADGNAGSGLLIQTSLGEDAVSVELVDSTGASLGLQSATVAGSTWSIDYAIRGHLPFDNYTINVQAYDMVGNGGLNPVGTIRLDERPSYASLNPSILITRVITTTTTLQGVVSEQPGWAGAVAQYHFEEAVDATTFADFSGDDNHLSCVNCPTTISGIFGQALDFDGVDDTLTTTLNSIITPTVTLATWIYPETLPSSQDAQLLTLGSNIVDLQINDEQGLRLNMTLTDTVQTINVTNVLSLNEWQHVASTFDGEAMVLYLNGVEIGSLAVTGQLPDTTSLTLNSDQLPYDGRMDEVTIYDRSLFPFEIDALAQADVRGVSAVEISVESYDDALNGIENWQPATLGDASGVALTDWSYDLGDIEGLYQIRLRSNDTDANMENGGTIWRGIVDTTAPDVTFTAQHLNSPSITEYSFIINDFVLDDSSFSHPCAAEDLTLTTYSESGHPLDGLVYNVVGACQVDGHQNGPFEVTACDVVGLCTTESVEPFLCQDTVATETELNDALSCFSQQIVADTYTVTLTADITLTASTITVTNSTPGMQLLIDGAGFAVDGGSVLGIRPFTIDNTAVTMQDITISGGYVTDTDNHGGGIYVSNGDLAVSNSTIGDNIADAGSGGGLFALNSGVTINNSTFNSNVSNVSGGAIASQNSTVDVTNSTFSANGAYIGAGIHADLSTITVTHSTLSEHTNIGSDGAVIRADDSIVNLLATILGQNGLAYPDCDGTGAYTFNDQGYNLVEYNFCSLTDPTTQTGLPLLEPLADNDGDTQTHAPESGSPALDAIPFAACTLSEGQRGEARPDGDGCEIGAYETVVPVVAYYPFEEGSGDTTADASGNGNDGEINGNGLWTTNTPSGAGYVANLDGWGSGAIINIPNESSFDLNVMSVALWVKVDRFERNRDGIVTKGDSAWRIERCLSNQKIAFGTTGLSNTRLCSTVTFDDNQWHHVVAVFDGNTKYLYVDGVLDNWVDVTGSISTNVYPVSIGYNAELITWFDGKVDELWIYKVALSADEVTALYNAPTAVADNVETAKDTAITIDALANDGDAQSDSLTIESVSQGSNGTVVNNNSDVTYTPNTDFTGNDSFTYTINDGNGNVDSATISVTVNLILNQLPTAVDDSATTSSETAVTIDVLANDTDGDNDPLVIDSVTQPSNGTAVNNGSDVTYTPNAGYQGDDTFTYTVSDGNGGTDVATVTVTVDSTRLATYQLDDPALLVFADSSGQGYTAACATIDSCPTFTTEVVNSTGFALAFDGSNDYVITPSIVDPATTNFTAATWFYLSADQDKVMLAQQNGSGTGRTWLKVTTDGQLQTWLSGDASLSSTGAVTVGQWHHATVSFDGTTVKLYLDGVLVDSDARTMNASDGNFVIGTNKSISKYFDGAMDELKIYTRTLADSEVQDLFNLVSVDQTNLVANFDFETVTDATLVDSSGNTLDGSCTTCPARSDGQFSEGLLFDGVDDYVSLPHIVDPASGSFSADLWFNITEHSVNRALLQQKDSSGSGRTWLGVQSNGTLYTYLGGSSL